VSLLPTRSFLVRQAAKATKHPLRATGFPEIVQGSGVSLRPNADIDRVREDDSPVRLGALAQHAVQDLAESRSLVLAEICDTKPEIGLLYSIQSHISCPDANVPRRAPRPRSSSSFRVERARSTGGARR
jgi:hypothetical protein